MHVLHLAALIRGRTRVVHRVPSGEGVPAEDLRPVSEVEAGVNFRSAGGVRGLVAGSLPRTVTPSLHPEVPDTRFVSPGRGLGIRQLMGWTKVCETARSGIWVPKGNARTRMLPDNLDHLRVGWKPQGSNETASMDVEQQSDYKPMAPSGMKLLVCGSGSRPSCLLGVQRENVPGVNLNRYSCSGSCIPWHSDNESLFGPPNQPKLTVSMSLGHSVLFQVRRVPGDVPSSITLDHGDLLIMDGSAQSEYAHRTVPGLQGPRVNLIFRWETQHISSCPLAGAMYCALPLCVQGLAELGTYR